MHGEDGVKEVRQPNTVRLGHQPKKIAFAVETPRTSLLNDLHAWLIMPIQKLVGHLAGWRLVGQLQRLGTEPLNAYNRGESIRQDAAHGSVGRQFFELTHVVLTSCPSPVRPARRPYPP